MGQLFQTSTAASEIAQHRVVFFGEIHSRPPIISFQREVQEAMAKQEEEEAECVPATGTLHVVFEHFSFDMQGLLDAHLEGTLSFDELLEKYAEIGTEGHDLEPYRNLLEDAKLLNRQASCRKVQLHAGFLSRKYARLLMKEGEDKCFQLAASWLPPNPQLIGTEEHYNIFESLLTGRSLVSDEAPVDNFRRIFKAQVLKDVAMAHKINTVVDDSVSDQDKVLVLVGNGHVLGYSGVPERFLQEHPELAAETCVLVSNHETDLPLNSGDERSLKNSILHQLTNGAWGPSKLSDYIYVYQEHQAEATSYADVKEETKAAYDKVGESAHLQGNTLKAKAIMKAMHYTDEQIATAGDDDVHNFQGVGNPHVHANIQPGETVLDVGSGLGIDSIIAQKAATDKGFVLGIDLSSSEVKHAQSVAQRRKLNNRLRFAAADMEQIPLPDNSVDVVISNGAFCLAPNKERAFREVFRVLKPGGRISICTTTTQDESKLEPGVSWPVCMKMFVAKNEIVPMCQGIGYVDVMVDDSDSSMSMELPVEVMQEENANPNAPQRSKVHVGSAEFSHLEDYDMDQLCARVCVVARKPSSG